MIATRANLLSLTAKELMTTEVVYLYQEMSVKEAALALVKHGISGAPVVDREGRCVGAFSTTDLLRSYSEKKGPRTTPVEQAITCPFLRALRDKHGCEISLCTLPLGVCAIQRVSKDASGHSQVVCSEPHSVPVEWGVVEVEKLPDDPVQCYMTPDPVMVRSELDIRALARMMIDAHIHRVIVIDNESHPLGVVSSANLLAAIAYTAEV
jgi:CBS domain-containing protein